MYVCHFELCIKRQIKNIITKVVKIQILSFFNYDNYIIITNYRQFLITVSNNWQGLEHCRALLQVKENVFQGLFFFKDYMNSYNAWMLHQDTT